MATRCAELQSSDARVHADSGEWLHLWERLDLERREVAKQLQRRHKFLERLRERSAQLQSLKDDHHRLRVESLLQKCNLQRLQKESEELQAYIDDEEQDIVALREGSRILLTQEANTGTTFVKDLEPELRIVAGIRERKKVVAAGAHALQKQQGELLEEQLRAENMRKQVLDDVNETQNELATARAQRVKLSRERQAIEWELASLAQQRVLGLRVTSLKEQSNPTSNDVPSSALVKDACDLPTVIAGDPPSQRWYAPTSQSTDDETFPQLAVVSDGRSMVPAGDPPKERETKLGQLCQQIDNLAKESGSSDSRKRSISPHWTRFQGYTNKADCVEWAGRLAQFQAQEGLIRSAEESLTG